MRVLFTGENSLTVVLTVMAQQVGYEASMYEVSSNMAGLIEWADDIEPDLIVAVSAEGAMSGVSDLHQNNRTLGNLRLDSSKIRRETLGVSNAALVARMYRSRFLFVSNPTVFYPSGRSYTTDDRAWAWTLTGLMTRWSEEVTMSMVPGATVVRAPYLLMKGESNIAKLIETIEGERDGDLYLPSTKMSLATSFRVAAGVIARLDLLKPGLFHMAPMVASSMLDLAKPMLGESFVGTVHDLNSARYGVILEPSPGFELADPAQGLGEALVRG